jgi:hypothetical protein
VKNTLDGRSFHIRFSVERDMVFPGQLVVFGMTARAVGHIDTQLEQVQVALRGRGKLPPMTGTSGTR